MSLLNVNKIDPATGTALEIGTSGDTILAVGFTENGVKANPASQTNHIKLFGGESLTADLRVKSLFLSNSLGGDQTFIEFEIREVILLTRPISSNPVISIFALNSWLSESIHVADIIL